MKEHCRLLCMTICVLAAALTARPVFAQAVAVAEISGVVTDPTGSPVPDAHVVATQTETSQTRETTTGIDGRYVLTALPVGPYTLEVSGTGFSTRLNKGLVLQVGNSITQNFTLEVGTVKQEVEVSASANMVETQNTSVSQVIDSQRIVDLPLNGRQATQLILLSGAATVTPAGDLVSNKNYPSSTTMSIAGGQGSGTNYLMDGGDNNDPWSNVNLPFPFPDALQEFSVENSSLPARYGLHPGGVVNVVTRSGTNAFHGDAFEFLRNGDFNARNFFATTQDTLRRNQFGGTIGGPVLKNKLFFFYGYQGTQTRTTPPNTISFVPTQAVLNGDFSTLESATCQSSGKARTITDPTTGTPFVNGQVNPARFNPVAVALLKSIPISTNPCGQVTYGIPNPQTENQNIGRFDYNINSKHQLFGRYFVTKYNAPAPTLTDNFLLSTQPALIDRSESAVVGDTYSLTASAVNSFHATWTRTQVQRAPAANLTGLPTLGANIYNPAPDFTRITIPGYFNIGCGNCAPAHYNRATVQVADDIDIIRGKHHFAFGVDWMHMLLNSYNIFNGNGSYDFNGSITGDALLDFLLGAPDNFLQGNVSRGNYRQNYAGIYGQDSIRVSSHFNVNLGLRWEPFLPAADIYNRGGSFTIANFIANKTSSVYTNAPPGLLFVGDPGIPKGYWNQRYKDFEPRVGVVWDPSGKGTQTIRAGYGFFYDASALQFSSGFNGQAPWGSQVSLTSPVGGLSNPFLGIAGGNPFPTTVPPPSTQAFPIGGTYITVPVNMHPTNMQQWDFSYQRQLTPNWLISATYLGNVTHHIWAGQAINPAVYIPGASTTKNTDARRVLNLINPATGKYYSSITSGYDGGNASYNGLLVSLRKRFSHNYTVLANYTYSHCISDADYAGDIGATAPTFENPNNIQQDRGNCNFDLRHNVNVSVVAQSPVFANHWAKMLATGWQFSPILLYHTGFWYSPLVGTDNSLTGVGLDRPNVSGDPYLQNTSTRQWLNPAAFTVAAPGTFGNAGRNSLVGPGYFDVDAALSRDFKVRESKALQLRFEFFNVFNHTNFNNPGATLSSKTFGQILSANDPRIIQLAAKFTF